MSSQKNCENSVSVLPLHVRHVLDPSTVRRPIGPATTCCWCHLPNHKGTDMHQHCRRVVRAGIERTRRRARKGVAGVGAGE
jgi:hypothetical protein